MAKLTQAERDALPASAFVFPSSRRYPIHDKGHAHAAIKDSTGTKDEATVRAAVRRKYGWDLSVIDGVTYDLAGHYNPNQPRDADGKWTDTLRRAGGGPVAFMHPGKPITKVVTKSPFEPLDAKGTHPADKGTHTPQSRHVYPKKQWVANRLRATAAASALGNPDLYDQSGLLAPQTFKPKANPARTKAASDVAPDAHLHAWFEPAEKTGLNPGANLADAQSWMNTEVKDEDRESLSSDLGLDPRLMKKSIRELRRAIKDKRTKSEDRAAAKTELAKRAAIAKAASHEASSWASNLADRLEGKTEETDLAPIIGETLAQHPKLGPLAHLWDRFRLGSYNFKKKLKSGEFTDELPRVIARNVVSVALMFLALHFGFAEIPGLGGGG